LKTKTIRSYKEIGLIHDLNRSESNYSDIVEAIEADKTVGGIGQASGSELDDLIYTTAAEDLYLAMCTSTKVYYDWVTNDKEANAHFPRLRFEFLSHDVNAADLVSTSGSTRTTYLTKTIEGRLSMLMPQEASVMPPYTTQFIDLVSGLDKAGHFLRTTLGGKREDKTKPYNVPTWWTRGDEVKQVTFSEMPVKMGGLIRTADITTSLALNDLIRVDRGVETRFSIDKNILEYDARMLKLLHELLVLMEAFVVEKTNVNPDDGSETVIRVDESDSKMDNEFAIVDVSTAGLYEAMSQESVGLRPEALVMPLIQAAVRNGALQAVINRMMITGKRGYNMPKLPKHQLAYLDAYLASTSTIVSIVHSNEIATVFKSITNTLLNNPTIRTIVADSVIQELFNGGRNA
jgi:hypothetical protein